MTNAIGGDLHGFVERDRPYFDDQTAPKSGWEALSRWGSRPAREFGRALHHTGAMVGGAFSVAFTRVANALRNDG